MLPTRTVQSNREHSWSGGGYRSVSTGKKPITAVIINNKDINALMLQRYCDEKKNSSFRVCMAKINFHFDYAYF